MKNLIFAAAFLLLAASCSPALFYTSPAGIVVKVDGPLVYVVYDVLSDRGGTVLNCYFFEAGHHFRPGDVYGHHFRPGDVYGHEAGRLNAEALQATKPGADGCY